ncbi:MAG: ABC transporter ATP-binding protein, partial [Lachnospiraceae bacterium]|nr:ABC transporter ATP-binding protein [Lachnospiraceae bacterium]
QQPVCEFSGGMKRRTAILRAILAPSDFIIMDEPFTGLDAETKQRVIDLILQYTEGKLLLISTHNEEDAELLSAKIIHLDHTSEK